MEQQKKNLLKGYFFSILGVLVLSFDTLLIQLTYKYNIKNLWIILFYRFIFYFLSSSIITGLLVNHKLIQVIKNIDKIDIICIIAYAICNIFFTFSITMIYVSNALAIYALSPIFTSVISRLWGEKINWWNIVTLFAILLTVISILVLDILDQSNNYKNKVLGYIFIFTATITTSIYYSLIKYSQSQNQDKNTLIIIPIATLITSVISFIVLIINQSKLKISNYGYLWLSIQGFIVLPISSILLNLSTKYISGTEANLTIILETLLGPFWIYLFGIQFTPKSTIIGIGIIVFFLIFNCFMSINNNKKKEYITI